MLFFLHLFPHDEKVRERESYFRTHAVVGSIVYVRMIFFSTNSVVSRWMLWTVREKLCVENFLSRIFWKIKLLLKFLCVWEYYGIVIWKYQKNHQFLVHKSRKEDNFQCQSEIIKNISSEKKKFEENTIEIDWMGNGERVCIRWVHVNLKGC